VESQFELALSNHQSVMWEFSFKDVLMALLHVEAHQERLWTD